MSRIINLNSPGKIRSQNQRTIAEILRRMSTKASLDDESKDMSAALVFLLREIYAGVIGSIEAWEKRGYWMKADRFMRDWEWTNETASNLEDVIRNDAWDLLPQLLAEMIPHSAGIELKRLTRPPSAWNGAHRKLLEEPPSESPW
ncbi:MAG TPA: hypothetical protein VFI27_18420 [candidate division Zixibacteria bacterium]|nr:hypothetical protein [candidate division Zixibacteria bacterium]